MLQFSYIPEICCASLTNDGISVLYPRARDPPWQSASDCLHTHCQLWPHLCFKLCYGRMWKARIWKSWKIYCILDCQIWRITNCNQASEVFIIAEDSGACGHVGFLSLLKTDWTVSGQICSTLNQIWQCNYKFYHGFMFAVWCGWLTRVVFVITEDLGLVFPVWCGTTFFSDHWRLVCLQYGVELVCFFLITEDWFGVCSMVWN